jgi:hypothetical protein
MNQRVVTAAQRRRRRNDKKKRSRKNEQLKSRPLKWAVVVCTMTPQNALYSVVGFENERAQATRNAEMGDALARAQGGESTASRTCVFAARVVPGAGAHELTGRCIHPSGDVYVTAGEGGDVAPYPAAFAVRPTPDNVAEARIQGQRDAAGAECAPEDQWEVVVFPGEEARAAACAGDKNLRPAGTVPKSSSGAEPSSAAAVSSN